MKEENTIQVNSSQEETERVKWLISHYSIGGIDVSKAEELGLFKRISYLLCAMHSLYSVAYMIFGEVDNLFDMTNAKRHEVKQEIEKLNKSYDRFFRFFRGYQTLQGVMEMNEETEALYHQFMRWCQLPEKWALGEEQLVPVDTYNTVSVDLGEREIHFHRTVVASKPLKEQTEEYCVTRYDRRMKSQKDVENNVDKASAQMIAKRMSANDKDGIYTASLLTTKWEKYTEATPLKVYIDGKVVGSYKKTIKSKIAD